MADVTVAGAGDGAYNGNYTENGTYDGKPCYELDGGGAWLYWDSTCYAGSWCLFTSKTTYILKTVPAYYGTGADLPANPWSDEQAAPPNPTLTMLETGQPMWARIETVPHVGV